ncbi:hypothetical protein BC826DRAFT_1020492 [Russula brevipes]|nr:hypothetical protein BC826DRAFT_1020492 [Russula brevipes]
MTGLWTDSRVWLCEDLIMSTMWPVTFPGRTCESCCAGCIIEHSGTAPLLGTGTAAPGTCSLHSFSGTSADGQRVQIDFQCPPIVSFNTDDLIALGLRKFSMSSLTFYSDFLRDSGQNPHVWAVTGQDILFLLFLIDTRKGHVLSVLYYYKGNE